MQGSVTRATPKHQDDGIVVTGSALRYGIPEVVEIAFSVLSSAQTAAQTVRDGSLRLQQIGRALTPYGVQAGDIQVSGMSLVPLYSTGAAAPENPGLAGYRLASTVRIVLRDPKVVGDLLDAATAAGAQVIQMVQFKTRDDASLKRCVLEAALEDARAKAAVLAGALGKQVGEVVTVVEDAGSATGTNAAMDPAALNGAGLAFHARVQAMFSLRPNNSHSL